MQPSRRRRVRAGSWSLALVVLAYLAGTFGDAGHWLTTAHRLCEVHGRLEHMAEAEAEARSAPAPRGPVVSPQPRPHGRCHLAELAVPQTVPIELAQGSATRLASEAAQAERPPRTAPSATRHGLCPSRSPPAA